jgi:predicted dehydrogenase
VVGATKMAVYDDTDPDTPLRVYDKGVDRLPFEGAAEPSEGFGEFKLQLRAGDMHAPRIRGTEPLRVEIEHFLECIRTGEAPLTDGVHGRAVVAILEAAERSAREGGAAVEIEERTTVGHPAA